jgi:hypothetical protein
MSEGHPSIAPSISRDTLVRLDRQGWSPSQVRQCMEMLDEAGLRLLAIFGDPRVAARVDGMWVIVIAGLVVPADPLRCMYRGSGSVVHGPGCPIDGLIADALLLAATTDPLTPDRIASMAEKLAPAVCEGFDSAEEARERIAQQVNLLLDRRLLVDACAANGMPTWKLTDRGSGRAMREIMPRWAAVASRRGL